MKETQMNAKRIGTLIFIVMILAATLLLASCSKGKTMVSKEVLNVPTELYVDEFDAEMKNIKAAVDACNIQLKIQYNDGSSEIVPLTFDMLEDVFKKQLNSEGNHSISYTYRGETIGIDVLVKLTPTYTVRFYDNNNNLISEQTVKQGKAAVEPTEAERAVAGYTFVSWDKAFDNVTENLDICGVYERIVPVYTVRFYDNNNNLISEQEVEEGKSAVEPSEIERAVAGYNFVSWDTAFDNVTGDLDVYGIYAKIPVYYTVRFYDNNNNLISEQEVEEGKSAVEPSEFEKTVAGYTFVRWDKAFDNVTGDLDVYGVYEKNIVYYTVRFYDNNNNLITQQSVQEGKAAVAPSAYETAVAGYIFIRWDKEFETVTGDLDVYGIYEMETGFIVKFYNCKNELIDTQRVPEGGNATAPADDVIFVPGYAFSRWDTELTNIVEDTEIYGIYITDTVTDTDGDGLTDYMEAEILGLDYSKKDTDGDGVTDDKEDTDDDGLSNITEINASLKPNNPDTDGDGLTDGDEIDIYWTLPADPDTDGDGANDGWEIENGFEPTEYNTSFEVEVSVPVGNTHINVEIPELSGDQVGQVIVEQSTDDAILNVHGSLGEAIKYNVTASANITFTSSQIATAEDPVLMYFNKETNEVEAIPVSVSGSEASASITKYGSYALVDRAVFEEKGQWRDVFEAGNYTAIEVILVIDDSGSLGGDYGYNSSTGTFYGGKDPAHKRLEAARNFVDSANANTKIGVVKFDGVVDMMTNGLITCDQSGKTSLKNLLKFTYVSSGEYNKHNVFDSRGYTYMYEGIDKALNQFTSNSPETLKIVVVFTDGEAHDTNMHNSVINKAITKDVKIYTVGLGMSSSYFTNYLQPLAEQTGGALYNVDNADKLSGIYDNIKEKLDMELDSDNDGISDFFESGVDKNGVPTLPTINGMSFVGLDKNNPDTDGDGYLDGTEIEIYKYYSDSKPNQVMIWGIVNSDPTDENSVPAA